MIKVQFNTITGVNAGFEILTREDFESIGHEAEWSLMLNLFCVRITFVKWPNE